MGSHTIAFSRDTGQMVHNYKMVVKQLGLRVRLLLGLSVRLWSRLGLSVRLWSWYSRVKC